MVMSEEAVNRILVVLFVLSIPIYPIAIPIWLAAMAWSVIMSLYRDRCRDER